MFYRVLVVVGEDENGAKPDWRSPVCLCCFGVFSRVGWLVVVLAQPHGKTSYQFGCVIL